MWNLFFFYGYQLKTRKDGFMRKREHGSFFKVIFDYTPNKSVTADVERLIKVALDLKTSDTSGSRHILYIFIFVWFIVAKGTALRT